MTEFSMNNSTKSGLESAIALGDVAVGCDRVLGVGDRPCRLSDLGLRTLDPSPLRKS
jgi:hypothetical protein